MQMNSQAGSLVGPGEYLFGMHSLQELVSMTTRGYLDMYLRPTELFAIQSGTNSLAGYGLYLLGLVLVIAGSHREILAVIVLLANAVPFAMTLGIDPRLGVQTIPFVTFILAYGLWWTFAQAVRFRASIGVPESSFSPFGSPRSTRS